MWLNDGGEPYVYVFDMTPSPLRTRSQQCPSAIRGPHWVTFGIDGRLAYVAGGKA